MRAAGVPPGTSPQLDLTDTEYDRIRRLLLAASGIALGDGKQALVMARLGRRVRALGLPTFSAYCDRLADGGLDASEQQRFLNCLTTNETRFWREPHHFAFIRRTLVSAWQARAAAGGSRRLRIWSAGCATGEEAYSLAITLLDALGTPLRWDIAILATDIDTDVLGVAHRGRYAAGALPQPAGAQTDRYFLPDPEAPAGALRARPEVRALVTFRPLNLVAPTWPLRSAFDLIFCRNVLIYFDRATQIHLIERFAAQLTVDGHLALGHSEASSDGYTGVTLVGPTIYRRSPPSDG